MEGYFFKHFFFGWHFFFWLLASGSFGFWLLACICCILIILEPKSLICLLPAAVWSQFACPFGFWAFGFWLLRFLASGLYLLHFGAKISDLRAICCSLEPLCMPIWLLAFGFWLWLHLTLGFWFLGFVVFFWALVSLGLWLLAAFPLNVCVVL